MPLRTFEVLKTSVNNTFLWFLMRFSLIRLNSHLFSVFKIFYSFYLNALYNWMQHPCAILDEVNINHLSHVCGSDTTFILRVNLHLPRRRRGVTSLKKCNHVRLSNFMSYPGINAVW